MKALNITQYTGIDGLQYQDVPEPTQALGRLPFAQNTRESGMLMRFSPKAWRSCRFPGHRVSKPRAHPCPR